MRSILPDTTGQSVMDCKMQKLIFCCLNTSFLCVLIRWNKKRENNVKNNKSITLFFLSYTLLFILQAGRLHPDKSSSRDPVYPAPDIHLSDASDQAGLGGVRRKRHSYPVLLRKSRHRLPEVLRTYNR